MLEKSMAPLDKKNYLNKDYLTGLTLLEILVSTLIMALVVMGLANIFIAGKRHILHSRSRMSGGELGKYFLDPLQMQVREDKWYEPYPYNNLALGSYTGESQNIQDITYTPFYTVQNVSADTEMRRVIVNIAWDEEP